MKYQHIVASQVCGLAQSFLITLSLFVRAVRVSIGADEESQGKAQTHFQSNPMESNLRILSSVIVEF